MLARRAGRGDEQTKFRVDDAVWHRTGDAGYLDARGRLWLLGRAEAKIEDDRGTVYPFAVECAASRIGGVSRSALIRHDSKRVLVVQAEESVAATLEAIVRDRLAWAKIDEVKLLTRIPLDARHNAKIDYPALRQLLDGQQTST